MDKVYMNAPFAKVNKTKDGGREVWGFATLERVDKSGEIADFDGTVKAFEKWSNEVSKRTDGKSLGNVRLMHQPIPVGKTIHWEPTDTTIKDDKGNDQVVKAIWVGAYVPPTKPDVVKDIDEGILSAFSIGGSYQKRWWDETAKAFRYIPELAEYSLVDNPCVEGADIVNVINKSHGPWDNENRNLEKGEELVNDLEKRAKLTGSYEELQNNIQNAVAQKLKGFSNYWDGYIVATMPDKVVAYDYNTRKYLEIPYTNKDGVITIGDNYTEVKEVTTYIPVETQKFIEAELEKRAKVTNAKKTPPKGYPTDKSQYGDPENYKYPIDEEHIKAAVSYFNHDGEKEKGGYSDEQWAEIGGRIASAANKLIEEGHKYKDGKIEVEKKEAKKLDKEEMKKAALAAGISEEQFENYFKAVMPKDDESTIKDKASKKDMDKKDDKEEDMKGMEEACKALGVSIDQFKAIKSILKSADPSAPTAPVKVTEIDGDFDTDKNMEFPKPGEPKIDIEGGTKDTEEAERKTYKAFLDDLKKSIEGLIEESNKVEKANVAISKSRMVHLKHAQNHIDAAVNGVLYGPEQHVKVESEYGKGNTGEEAPEVTEKAMYGDLKKGIDGLDEKLAKAVTAELNKSISKIEALFKGVANSESLTKMYDEFKETAKLVKEIHETPQSNNLVFNGGSPDMLKALGQGGHFNMPNMEDAVLEKFVSEIKDPLVRDKAGQELAIRKAKQALK